jgi:hypothetical protein
VAGVAGGPATTLLYWTCILPAVWLVLIPTVRTVLLCLTLLAAAAVKWLASMGKQSAYVEEDPCQAWRANSTHLNYAVSYKVDTHTVAIENNPLVSTHTPEGWN